MTSAVLCVALQLTEYAFVHCLSR